MPEMPILHSTEHPREVSMQRKTLALIAAALVLVAAAVVMPVDEAAAITRLEIIGRAKRWVDLEVSYSQRHFFEGYRQDCSGMTSMAWKLGHSYTSWTLPPQGEEIHRDELQPGDMICKPHYHALVFYKWADADHTMYWALEQSGSVGHAVERLAKYPYWNHDNVRAYRHRDIEEIDDYAPYIHQVAGTDRYGTALAASQLAFASNSTTHAVVCSGEDWPDALGGSALAGALDAPVLLVGRDMLPDFVKDEIVRLGASQVTVLGGEGAVSPAVAAGLGSIPGVAVNRLGGADRYQTAALIASATIDARRASGEEWDGGVYLATGLEFADALGCATVAAHTGRPILLSRPETLTPVASAAIASFETSRAYVAGGLGALTTTVTAGLEETGVWDWERFAGSDRYDTSFMLARHGEEEGLVWDDVAIATGETFPDALAGAAMQAKRGSGLVLTPSTRLAPGADWAIRDHIEVVDVVTVLGGEGAVQRLPRRQIRWIMDEP
jgi:putative cell wall-binding protein